MKKIIVMIFVSLFLLTGCSKGEKYNIENNDFIVSVDVQTEKEIEEVYIVEKTDNIKLTSEIIKSTEENKIKKSSVLYFYSDRHDIEDEKNLKVRVYVKLKNDNLYKESNEIKIDDSSMVNELILIDDSKNKNLIIKKK